MRHSGFCGVVRAATVMVGIWVLAGTGYATDCYWIHDPNTPSEWDSGNWDPSCPIFPDAAVIDNGGTARITWSWPTVTFLTVGGTYAGSLVQPATGSRLEVWSHSYVGFDAGATGTYDFAQGSFITRGYEYIGYSGDGTLTQSNGVNWAWGLLYLGYNADSTGNYDLRGGLLKLSFSTSYEVIGNDGTGIFNQSGGTHDAWQHLCLGRNAGAVGSYTLSGGRLGTGALDVGLSGSGSFTQSGGSVTTSDLRLAAESTSTGIYILSGGALGTKNLDIGRKGAGSFVQTGGTVGSSGDLCLAGDPGATGAYTLSGGSLVVRGGIFGVAVGDKGSAEFTQTGGTLLCPTDYAGLSVGRSAGGTGRYTLSGGSLIAGSQTIGGSGNGIFIQTGGTNFARSSFGVGTNAGASGTYVLAGGSFVPPAQMEVGASGNGLFVQGAGLGNLLDYLMLGANSGGTGTYVLEAGSFRTRMLFVGDSGSGRFTQTGGSARLFDFVFIGRQPDARGVYELSGGTLSSRGTIAIASGPRSHGSLCIRGGSFTTTVPMFMGDGDYSTAEFSVSKSAYADVNRLTIGQGTARSSKVAVEVAADGSSLIHTRAKSTLGGALDVQGVGGFRPREGDKFTVISCSDPSGVCFTGDFSSVTSNISLGLPLGTAAFTGVASGRNYEVTFQGYTAGDADGDHKVDGGDLALMSGAWMMSGQTWSTGDFNGDPNGKVDGGDLALMGGNWMWSLSAAPPGAPLPEPATVAMMALAGCILVRRRR